MSIRVLIADDLWVVRATYRDQLRQEPDILLVGEASNGQRAIQAAEKLSPDVVAIDIEFLDLDGLEVAERIRASQGHVKILVVAMEWSQDVIREAIQSGVSGYMAKIDLAELGQAVRAVYEGQRYFSSTITESFSGQDITA